jgi:hypothetical protein
MLVGLGLTALVYLAAKSPKSKPAAASATPSPTPDPHFADGSFTDAGGSNYHYEILHEKSATNYVITYSPYLPRDDTVMVQAVTAAIAKTYGADTHVDPTPTVTTRNGVNLVTFKGDGATYYVLINKEATGPAAGHISAMTYWRE